MKDAKKKGYKLDNEGCLWYLEGEGDIIGIFLLSEGPLATRFQFDLVSDFATRTQVDLGELGGKTLAKAKFEGNKLITHIHNKKTGVHFLTATREMDASEYHTKCKY